MITLPPLSTDAWINAVCLYNNFVLSRYVTQDMAEICGSVFDTPGMKTFILFMFVYSASRNIQVATVMTIGIVIMNMMLARNSACYSIDDRYDENYIGVGFWTNIVPTNTNPFSAHKTDLGNFSFRK
jgi:hypothetical protein